MNPRCTWCYHPPHDGRCPTTVTLTTKPLKTRDCLCAYRADKENCTCLNDSIAPN